jgi:acyl-CoA thioesterase-1
LLIVPLAVNLRRLAATFVVLLATAAGALGADQKIVVVGDSLSSGYGLGQAPSWVALLEERLAKEGYGYEVVNASISGDTSAGGLSRLPRLLETHDPALVILELGGNDGLRGQPVASLRGNLEQMIELAKASGARVLLAGIQIPPNYGQTYTRALAQVYPDLAAAHDVPLLEFLLDGVALNPALMQGDGLHPNAAGQKVIYENVWRILEPLL